MKTRSWQAFGRHRQKAGLTAFGIFGFAVAGTILLYQSHAATPAASIEPEAGTISAAASSVADTSASGSHAVKFGSGSGGGTTSACPVYPTFPDANCTGWQHTGTTLTAYTGPDTIDTDGTVISGKDINTCLYISASNVTIKNSRIRCAGSGPTDSGVMIIQFGSAYVSPTGLTLTDDEISRPDGSNGGADYAVLVYGDNVTMTRDNIHNVTSGVHLGSNTVITDSYIHDLVNISGSDHNDDIITNGGSNNLQLIHNNFQVPISQTTPIAIYDDSYAGGGGNGILVQNNLLNGGGYCMYMAPTTKNLQVLNNHFGKLFFAQCGQYGVSHDSLPATAGSQWSGNVWDDTGATVSP